MPGLEISAGKMSALWTGTPTTIRLDDLDVICAVLDCSPDDLLLREPEKVAARRRAKPKAGGHAGDTPTRRLGRHRSLPPGMTPAERPCQPCRATAGGQPRGSYCFDCAPRPGSAAAVQALRVDR